MRGIILAAGKGRRLRPLTHTGPKHLLPIAGKPIIRYGIDKLKEIGLAEIGVVVGYRADDVKECLKDGSDLGISIRYILQPVQRGIAHALKVAEEYLSDDRLVVYLGDNLLKQNLKKFADDFERENCDALILLSRVRNPERFGVAVLEGGKVTRLVEKPRENISDLALVGIYFFKPVVFKAIHQIRPSWRNELEITDAIQWLVDHGYNVKAKVVKGWWADTGTELDLLEANRLILEDLKPNNEATVDDNVRISGNVRIREGTKIDSETVLMGPTYIGKNCIVRDAAIGPFASIGDRCEIMHSKIENSMILDDCRIRLRRRIAGSIIGKRSTLLSADKNPTNGCKLILGKNSKMYL